jgi:hypothetical protein
METVTEKKSFQNLSDLLNDLGGISPSRVVMRKPFGLATEEDLIELNETKTTLCELVDGMLVEKGMGYNESDLTLVIAGYLRAFIVP